MKVEDIQMESYDAVAIKLTNGQINIRLTPKISKCEYCNNVVDFIALKEFSWTDSQEFKRSAMLCKSDRKHFRALLRG